MNSESETVIHQIEEYKKYEVDWRACDLYIGDPVTPETVIGLHHETRRPVTAGLDGRIVIIYYNPMHDSLMILAVSGDAYPRG